MSFIRLYNSTLIEAKDNCIHELERENAELRNLLPECLAMAEAWEDSDGDHAVELVQRLLAAMEERK